MIREKTHVNEIAGIIPVVHTPFDKDQSIDFESFQRQIEWAFQQPIHGLCTGMVSELLRLSPTERFHLTEALVSWTRGRGVVVVGIGAESTKQALEFGHHAAAAGAAGVMAIPPVTTAISSAQLEGYYRTLLDEIPLPLIVQDASSYVGQEIPLEMCVRLLDQYGPQKVLFKPEASPIGPRLSQLRDATEGRARILEGSGGMFLIDSFRRGIVGTIPGMEFLPAVVDLWQALQQSDEQRAYAIGMPLNALVALQLQAGLDGFLAVEKYLMVQRGLFTYDLRRTPWSWELDEETRLELERLLALLQQAREQHSGDPDGDAAMGI
ncbi:MAG: dihydrodipicolinate synthase family protein [Planctomycetaceae bacterium]